VSAEPTACVAKVFCEVIEQMAFMFGESAEREDMPGLSEDGLRIRMGFSGPMEGELTMAAPRDAGVELAANVLGLDAEDPVASLRAEDALKELLNVTCGSLLTELAGDGPVFHLTVPQSSALKAAEWAELLEEDGTVAFRVDDHPVLLNVRVNTKG
jgi:CheY-specific phosphatase CheX